MPLNNWVQAPPGGACLFLLSQRPGTPDPYRSPLAVL